MFAYCVNNPVVHVDSSGASSVTAFADESSIFAPTDDPISGGGFSSALSTAVGSVLVFGLVSKLSEEKQAHLATLALKNKSNPGLYTVYFLCAEDDLCNKIIYVGRVKTANLQARLNYHASRGRRLVKQIDGLSYEACRALEQAGMVYYHTINREAAINNQIRGISPYNGNRYIYMAALWDILNRDLYTGESCIPYSYLANLTEEMFLNGTP